MADEERTDLSAWYYNVPNPEEEPVNKSGNLQGCRPRKATAKTGTTRKKAKRYRPVTSKITVTVKDGIDPEIAMRLATDFFAFGGSLEKYRMRTYPDMPERWQKAIRVAIRPYPSKRKDGHTLYQVVVDIKRPRSSKEYEQMREKHKAMWAEKDKEILAKAKEIREKAAEEQRHALEGAPKSFEELIEMTKEGM